MSAYAETYLLETMENVGAATDFATSVLGLSLQEFWGLFTASEVCRGIEGGMPWALVGITGEEMALRACWQAGLKVDEGDVASIRQVQAGSSISLALSREYWCGYSLTFLQWHIGMTFSQIEKRLSVTEVAAMYPTFHEESEERFLEAGLEMMARNCPTCGLKRQRELVGLSQSQLAKASGVGLRAIQQYEQGAKRIDCASFTTVQQLACTLHCRPSDLLYTPECYEYAIVSF